MKTSQENKKAQILVIGGGVSGASLAIRLAQRDLKVILVEKDKFPRHKLCGEFVSPECLSHFESLGVLDSMREIGGDSIYETRFFSQSGKSIGVPSEWFFDGKYGALGISRSEMDFCLLQKARETGAETIEESRVVTINIESNRLSGVTIKNKQNETTEIDADLIVDATGRARVLGKLLEKNGKNKPRKEKIKHVAFKTHFGNVNLDKGICEIYFFRGGYGGLSYVEKGFANHCFLIDSKVVREFNGDADHILREVIFKNERAFEMMKKAEKKFDWLAVSVEKFGKQPSHKIHNLISIGDAAAFIDPFTGSGMLMALESSEILASAILGNLNALNLKNSQVIKATYEEKHAGVTRRRLRACSVMRNLSFSPNLANLLILIAKRSNNLLQRFTSMTRPA